MRITKNQLKQIIKETLAGVLEEDDKTETKPTLPPLKDEPVKDRPDDEEEEKKSSKVKEGKKKDHDGDGDIDSDDYLAAKDKAIKSNIQEATGSVSPKTEVPKNTRRPRAAKMSPPVAEGYMGSTIAERFEKHNMQVNESLMEKWGYGSPSGNMITEATGSDGQELDPKDSKSWDVVTNPNAELGTPLPASRKELTPSRTGVNTRASSTHVSGKSATSSKYPSGGKRAGLAPTKEGKVVQEQDDFDLDDLDDDNVSAPDVQSPALDATVSTAAPSTTPMTPTMMEKASRK